MRRLLFAFCYLTFVFNHLNADEPKKKPIRARLPSVESLQNDIFFKNAFKEGLQGTRPANLGAAQSTLTAANKPQNSQQPKPGSFRWSSVVSARTLEDEVKSLQIQLQKTITTPSKFSGGGYLEARRMFTELATLFAVVQQYDRDVRWKSQAALARDLFTRAAANTKTTSIQAYNESKQRKFDLEELVRGGTLTSAQGPKQETDWSLINRAALMKRFTVSYDEGVAIWTANESNMKANKSNIQREAELLRLFSRVLTQEGMEDGEDEDYAAYSRQLEQASQKVLVALEDNDAQAARKAASDVGQSCVACHDDYRG